MPLQIMADVFPMESNDVPTELEFGGRRWFLSTPEPVVIHGCLTAIYSCEESSLEMQVVFDE